MVSTRNELPILFQGYKWVPIREDGKEVVVYHQIQLPASRIAKQLAPLASSNIMNEGLPWNPLSRFNCVVSNFENIVQESVHSAKDVRFSPRGVVIEFKTSEGVYYLKACPSHSAEALLCHFTGRNLPRSCEVPEKVVLESCWIITKPQGPSPNVFSDSEPRLDEAAHLLANMQISSIDYVNYLIEKGALDGRLCHFADRVAEICNHVVLKWILRRTEYGRRILDAIKLFTQKETEITATVKHSLANVPPYPPVLLHNDLLSGNIYQDKFGNFKMFDWGFACVGHPFMYMTVRLMPERSRGIFCQTWRNSEYKAGVNYMKIFANLIVYRSVLRLLMLLKIMRETHENEKYLLVPIVYDFVDLLLGCESPQVYRDYGSVTNLSVRKNMHFRCRFCPRNIRMGKFSCSASNPNTSKFNKMVRHLIEDHNMKKFTRKGVQENTDKYFEIKRASEPGTSTKQR